MKNDCGVIAEAVINEVLTEYYSKKTTDELLQLLYKMGKNYGRSRNKVEQQAIENNVRLIDSVLKQRVKP